MEYLKNEKYKGIIITCKKTDDGIVCFSGINPKNSEFVGIGKWKGSAMDDIKEQIDSKKQSKPKVPKEYLKRLDESYDWFMDKSVNNKRFATKEILLQHKSIFPRTEEFGGSNQYLIYDVNNKQIYNSDVNSFTKSELKKFIVDNTTKDIYMKDGKFLVD